MKLMTIEESLKISIPQDIELVEKIAILKEVEKKLKTGTSEEKMDEVNAILKMTAEKKGCSVSDLQWRRDKYGAIHIRRKESSIFIFPVECKNCLECEFGKMHTWDKRPISDLFCYHPSLKGVTEKERNEVVKSTREEWKKWHELS